MSWKSDNDADCREGGLLLSCWPIAVRLTIFYAFTTLLVLVLINLILYWEMVKQLNVYSDNFVTHELSAIKMSLLRPDGEKIVARDIEHSEVEQEFVRHFIRVQDKEGRTLIENSEMGKIVPGSAFLPPDPASITHGKWKMLRSQNGKTYILKSLRTEIDGFGADGLILQVAMDVSELELFKSWYFRQFVLMLSLGLIGSVIAGSVVARNGLRPLAKITKTAEHISANHLTERIIPERWPKELATLAVAFDRMLDRLEKSFDELRHCTANLAHELRTPINNLMIEADIALSRNRTQEEYQKVIGSNMEEYARLSRIIDSLLFLARSDNAQNGITFSRLDGRREIEDIAEFYSGVARDKDITVICEGAASLYADQVLFRRAVGNLLSNALTYTPEGGKIVISTRQADNQSVTVAVSDTGCGIAPEHNPKVFERFYRVDATRQTNPSGCGLGLAIVKAIMEKHGGNAGIESVPGKGSRVFLTFPPPAHAVANAHNN